MRLARIGPILLAVVLPSVWVAGTAAAAAPSTGTVHTVPAANEVLSAAPAQLEVLPPNAATTGAAKVLDSSGKRIIAGSLNPVGGGALGFRLPALGTGVYLVGWSAGTDTGAFAFDVTGGARSPAIVVEAKPTTTLGPLQDNLVYWVPLISIMILVGALALRFLVSAPAARRANVPAALEGSDLRLVRIAAVASAIFVPTTVAELAYRDGRFDFASIWPSLGADGAGHIVGARLVFTALAALLVIPLALRRARPAVPLMAAGLVCGLLELTARKVPTAVPPNVPRTIVNTVLYVAHLWGAAIWIGGLVGLLGLALRNAIPTEARRAFWPTAIRRFSLTAMSAVGVLTLSGLWLYWVHVDGFDQLVTTLYGRTLLVKLVVVAVLVLIGATNQFWLMPRIDSQQVAGDQRGLSHTLLRHFRLTIAAEVVLGLGVLFIAPLLAGSARNQAFQASPAALTQTASAGATRVELTPSGLQPGLVDYHVNLDGSAAPRQVSLSFASTKLGVAGQEVTAASLGEGSYRVSGYYTPVVGTWQVAVRLDDAATARFTLPITAKPAKLPKAAPPKVRWTTWVAGIAETLLVALALYSSYRISQQLTTRRIKAQPPTGEPESDRGLINA